MTAFKRVVWNDGDLVQGPDLSEIGTNIDLWLAQDLFRQLFDAGEYIVSAGTPGPALDDASVAVTLVTGQTPPVDFGSTALRTYGFLGDGLRVVRANAAQIQVQAGWGVQFADTGAPTGESQIRVVRLANALSIAIAAAAAGQYIRYLALAQWHDAAFMAPVQNMDATGAITSVSEKTRVSPELNDVGAGVLNVRVVAGTPGATTTLAARPAIPAGWVPLAEILVDPTGIANAANVNGATPGILDLRPRLIPRKAAGFSAVRRATCSQDEGTAMPSGLRIGAKAVGEEVIRGVLGIPTSATVVMVDTSRDWRDLWVEINHSCWLASTSLPGGVADNSCSYVVNPVGGGSASMGGALFYAGTGSVDGTAGYTSPHSCTVADGGTGLTLTFFADSTTGALKCRCNATSAGFVYFRAAGFGPTGRRPPAGVEA